MARLRAGVAMILPLTVGLVVWFSALVGAVWLALWLERNAG